jgi:hypothetical protein
LGSELMTLGRDLMMSQAPSMAAKAHDLAGEAGDAIKSGEREIKAALRRLGLASDISEASSLDLPPPTGGQQQLQVASPRSLRPS